VILELFRQYVFFVFYLITDFEQQFIHEIEL